MKILRPNMAKDVIKKKQRIAHNKANECHEMYTECNDFLATIMQGMDNNDLMAAMCPSKFPSNLFEQNKTTLHEKTQNSVNQIPNHSQSSVPKLKKFGLCRKGPLMAKSQRTLKQLQHNRKLPKPRAHLAGLSNSQAFNKSISSDISKIKDMNNTRNISKFQNKVATKKQLCNRIAADGNKMNRQSIEKSKSKEITSKKMEPSIMGKKCSVKETSCIVGSVSKKHESALVKKNSPEKSSHIANKCDKIADNSSDSDEYEKFIQKEKKDLPKKSKKNSCNIKSQKPVKKVSRKRASESVSTESESDLTDEESLDSYKSKKMRKTHNVLDNNGQSACSIKNKVQKKESRKCNSRTILKYVSPSSDSDGSGPSTSYAKKKKVHKKLNRSCDTFKDDSESQMDINDETYHDSSESDDLPPPSEIMHGLPSSNSQFPRQMDNQHESELSFHSNKAYNIPSIVDRDEPNILCNKISSCEISNIASLVSSNQPNILQDKTSSYEIPNIAANNVLQKSSDIHSLVGSAQPSVSHKTPDLPSLYSVHIKAESLDLQKNFVSNNSQQENSPEPLIVDLVESDNEYEDSFTVIPKIVETFSQNQKNSRSEGCEIELLDVVIPPDCSNEYAGYIKNTSELNIKTEKADGTTPSIAKSQNTKSNPESQTSLSSKQYEVAYTTGICQKLEENDSKDKIRKQLNLNDNLHNERNKSEDSIVKQLSLNNRINSDIACTSKDSSAFNKVKKEPSDGDECEIILDTTSTSNSSTNLSNIQINNNTSIKVEKDSEVVKQDTAICNINENSFVTRESNVKNAKTLLVLNKKVKKEPSDGDECEIILDTTSTSNSSTNFSTVQIHSNKSIKVERDCKAAETINFTNDGPIGARENKLTEKEQKLHEIPCSTLTNLINSHSRIVQSLENETINGLSNLDIKALLENLKKEFATYQEILVTEQSVGTTFKILEKCQAERLNYLKTTIVQCLESAPSNSDCNSLKIAVNKLLDSSELNSSTSLKDGTKVPTTCLNENSSTSDISMQDLKTLATMNIVPLSSISEKDIKPNLSDLQSVVKQEPNPSYEINSMSFGEKCIVCAKDASAACQQCAKVFFCSNECGRKYWEDGHKNACIR